MSPLFEVVVRGGDERAAAALRASGLWVAGPPLNDAGTVLFEYLFVLADEYDPDIARERVEGKLPGGDYVVEHVNRLEPE